MEHAIAPSHSDPKLTSINGIVEPTIERYFDSLNQGDFQATAALFVEQGTLHAPFEPPIVGREAIANYLEAEAKGMQMMPHEGILRREETGDRDYELVGKVHTPLFSVNVSWTMQLNGQSELVAVHVKLLASLKDLLTIKS